MLCVLTRARLTAAVAALLHVGKAMHVDADQVLAWAADLGYNLAFHAQLYQFIREYMKGSAV